MKSAATVEAAISTLSGCVQRWKVAHDALLAENERLRNYVAVIASGMPREDLLAIEREFGEPVDGRLP